MKVLVTGGTGLPGSRLLRRSADAGVDCLALVHPGKEALSGVPNVEGDLLDLAPLPADDLSRILAVALLM